jgi:hypothetical protein
VLTTVEFFMYPSFGALCIFLHVIWVVQCAKNNQNFIENVDPFNWQIPPPQVAPSIRRTELPLYSPVNSFKDVVRNSFLKALNLNVPYFMSHLTDINLTNIPPNLLEYEKAYIFLKYNPLSHCLRERVHVHRYFKKFTVDLLECFGSSLPKMIEYLEFIPMGIRPDRIAKFINDNSPYCFYNGALSLFLDEMNHDADQQVIYNIISPFAPASNQDRTEFLSPEAYILILVIFFDMLDSPSLENYKAIYPNLISQGVHPPIQPVVSNTWLYSLDGAKLSDENYKDLLKDSLKKALGIDHGIFKLWLNNFHFYGEDPTGTVQSEFFYLYQFLKALFCRKYLEIHSNQLSYRSVERFTILIQVLLEMVQTYLRCNFEQFILDYLRFQMPVWKHSNRDINRSGKIPDILKHNLKVQFPSYKPPLNDNQNLQGTLIMLSVFFDLIVVNKIRLLQKDPLTYSLFDNVNRKRPLEETVSSEYSQVIISNSTASSQQVENNYSSAKKKKTVGKKTEGKRKRDKRKNIYVTVCATPRIETQIPKNLFPVVKNSIQPAFHEIVNDSPNDVSLSKNLKPLPVGSPTQPTTPEIVNDSPNYDEYYYFHSSFEEMLPYFQIPEQKFPNEDPKDFKEDSQIDQSSQQVQNNLEDSDCLIGNSKLDEEQADLFNITL